MILYKGNNPFQPFNTSFVVNNDQLLIFAWTDTNYTVKVNNVLATKTLVKDLGGYKVYSVNTPIGATVKIEGVSDTGARRIQGYLSQNSSNPVYNISSLQFALDAERSNTMFLTPGNYSYVFFDKYTENAPSQGTDLRKVTVLLSGSTIVNKTYVQPFPNGTQGAVTDIFSINSSGN